MARILEHIKNGIKQTFTNLGESEYSKNNRRINGDTRSTKQVRTSEWDGMSSTVKKVIKKIK
jgi:hypothetical protein